MIPYNRTLNPPAPFLALVIANRINRRWRATLPALLDTGSEITAIPEPYIERLRLYPVGQIQLTGIHSTKIDYTYSLHLQLLTYKFPDIEVVSTPLEFAVVGREILNELLLTLDGPSLTFSLEGK
jgi:hypothetical protein